MWKSPRPFREEQISGTLVVCLPHYLQYFYSLLSTTVTGAQRWQNQWMSTNSQNQNHSRWRSGMWSPCGVGTLNAMSVPYAEHRSWVSSVSWYWHTIVTIGMVRTPVRPLEEGIQLLKERTWKHILYISPPPPKKNLAVVTNNENEIESNTNYKSKLCLLQCLCNWRLTSPWTLTWSCFYV